jgi:hypothetical protein
MMEVIIGIIILVIIVLVLWLNFSGSTRDDANRLARSAEKRAADLPSEQRAVLAAEVRKQALKAYDSIFEAAQNAGKNDTFAHQVGVLQALTAITVPEKEISDKVQRELQMESAPFTKTQPDAGRLAVAEYAVWKFFPAESDENIFAPLLCRFRDQVFQDENITDEIIFSLLYSMRYDWQRWLSENKSYSYNN